MPRLAICSRDLYWHWINRTLLYDTMEVSRGRCQCSAELGWPSHSMCSSPHWQVGQSWFHEKLSPANREQRLSRWADFAKNCLPRIGSKVLPRFREKYRALGRQKNGVQHATAIYPIPRYTRPRYIGLTLYWLCRICRSWSYLRRDFKSMRHINVE